MIIDQDFGRIVNCSSGQIVDLSFGRIVVYTSLGYIMRVFSRGTAVAAAATATTTTGQRFGLRFLWNVNIRYAVVLHGVVDVHDVEMLRRRCIHGGDYLLLIVYLVQDVILNMKEVERLNCNVKKC